MKICDIHYEEAIDEPKEWEIATIYMAIRTPNEPSVIKDLCTWHANAFVKDVLEEIAEGGSVERASITITLTG